MSYCSSRSASLVFPLIIEYNVVGIYVNTWWLQTLRLRATYL